MTEKAKFIKNKNAPCLEKGCSFCCNPVAIDERQIKNIGEENLPADKNGDSLFSSRKEILYSKKNPDSTKFMTFNCKNFDSNTGLCRDYENRPDLCRNTSCINVDSVKSVDEQRKDFIDQIIK